ncbi:MULTISPECIES: hypothetical protein [unclassified Crossiella]|uniref:hypothetical protein n=1 Tax=unclassified Crossiella TaxID=2620835 RepID=UPI0020003BDA|nr:MULTISPECIES: hypothetical protein [unclassified Crossiella]MCK2240994.1 hypothetical protein [Crossiella sp. S99.2]MCK2253862.1 hypothetical protein [Crossiella sp. S99.1]
MSRQPTAGSLSAIRKATRQAPNTVEQLGKIVGNVLAIWNNLDVFLAADAEVEEVFDLWASGQELLGHLQRAYPEAVEVTIRARRLLDELEGRELTGLRAGGEHPVESAEFQRRRDQVADALEQMVTFLRDPKSAGKGCTAAWPTGATAPAERAAFTEALLCADRSLWNSEEAKRLSAAEAEFVHAMAEVKCLRAKLVPTVTTTGDEFAAAHERYAKAVEELAADQRAHRQVLTRNARLGMVEPSAASPSGARLRLVSAGPDH